jgi:DNA-directed RNA polymerase specialized sigma24 family protein
MAREKSMASSCDGSITRFVGDLKTGDTHAAEGLWERYSGDLIRLARARLRATSTSRAAADEEDVALSAFGSFCAGAARGQFPQLEDRDDLWKILVTTTVRKATDLVRQARRQKRGMGRVVAAADLGGAGLSKEGDPLALIPGPDPTPDFAVLVAEECHRLLGLLHDDGLREIALERMAGYHDEEIAVRLRCSRRTVMRKLIRIRNAWRAEVER